jgi:bifunctional aspartokinase / homoserine dehydrogenase 1
LISVGGADWFGVPDVFGRALRAAAAVRADVLMASQASAQNHLSLIVPTAQAKNTLEALRHEFAHELENELEEELLDRTAEHILLDGDVAIVTLVGQKLRSMRGLVARIFAALEGEEVEALPIAQASSDCTFSFVVRKQDIQPALSGLHREFELGSFSRGAAAEGAPEVYCQNLSPLGSGLYQMRAGEMQTRRKQEQEVTEQEFQEQKQS